MHNLISETEIETLCIEVYPPHQKSFVVSAIYKPPDCAMSFYDNLEKYVYEIEEVNKNLILIGDFNCNFDMSKNQTDPNYAKLRDLSNLFQLDQLINDYTRVTDKSKTIIDLIFTTDPTNHFLNGVFPTTLSDYYTIFTVIN